MSTALVSSKDKQATIKDLLERSKTSIAAVLPKHLTPERLLKVALSATARNPSLLACTPQSILLAVMQSAELGLEIGGLLGEAYFVPFKGTIQLIVGYRGLLKLARNSGQLKTVEVRIVNANDYLEIEYGLNPKLVHKPCLTGDPGEMVHVYAIAHYKDEAYQSEFMTRAQIDAIRTRSKAGTDGPWVTDFDEMAKKTVLRRLLKTAPLSPELANALEHETAVEQNVPSPVIDVSLFETEEAAPVDRGDALAAKVAAKNGKTPEAPAQAPMVTADGEVLT
jgi:recombination protein RecT